MDQDNPYAAPQVALVDAQAPQQLPGWSPGQLRLLGWLCLLSIASTLAALVAAVLASEQPGSVADMAGDWLSLLSTLLGCYLLLRLRVFLEQRFAAKGLRWPTGLIIFFSLLTELLDWLWGDAILASLGWQTLSFFAAVLLLGVTMLWLGVVLLRVQDPYPSLRVMAWLEIAGGVMFTSVILILIAIIPLLAASLAMALVFFRGASELSGRQAA
ncbi:hypothetical protein AAFN46_14640 [Pseudomonas sp. CAU 1711]|uniref:hypothetical protein n=1 Tax=Pseudomonas sp. CAU 1711 TaxID=3140356 RepID=UPI0032606E39